MKQKYTISRIRSLLGNHENEDKIPDDIKLFIDLAACIFGGTVAGPVGAASAASFATIITSISQKGVILDAAKRAIELLRKDNPPYAERCNRIREAYAILWIASFFDAFENTVRKSTQKKLALAAKEKESIARIIWPSDNLDSEFDLPELIYDMDKVCAHLKNLYTNMAERLQIIISGLAFSEVSCDSDPRNIELQQLNIALKELPDKALETFKIQYFNLCSQFGEFATLMSFEREQEYKLEIEARFSALAELLTNTRSESELTFQQMDSLLLSYSEARQKQEAAKVIKNLNEHYKYVIHQPIVKNNQDNLVFPSPDPLIYPLLEDSFIPQRYKLMEYKSNTIRLELKNEWDKYPDQKDLFTYLGKYLSHVQSVSCLMLILGDPGSGKSRLTEIISAMPNVNTELVVRIPLRKYWNLIGKREIEDIICKQIEQDGNYKPIKSFQWLVGEKPQYPSTIIFDGYDEIQQATGSSYSDFLTNLSTFQESCLEKGQPVRIIITSRKALIDKVDIPIGTLVVNLLPFDEYQKERWINIWNRTNHEQFKKAGLKDFALPDNIDIQDLSRLPLLLLMLAIFDADFENKQNALETIIEKTENHFNRTHLYDKLIRRFVRRELSKSKAYLQTTSNERTTMEQLKMEKLGITALGMFAREKLDITVHELKDDFLKLGTSTKKSGKEGTLKAEEVFLGSFFFIHESRTEELLSQGIIDETIQHNTHASYTFLHKTFYEFLTANYILDCLFEYTIAFIKMNRNKSSKDEKELRNKWQRLYIAINGAALCNEPEIVSMIYEWWQMKADRLLIQNTLISEQVFLSSIEDEIKKQTECIRKGNMEIFEIQSLLPDRPTHQLYAIFILNLITLMVLCKGKWNTDMETWRFLAQYIKLFSPISKLSKTIVSEDNLQANLTHYNIAPSEKLPLRFMALFQINNDENNIEIQRRNNSDSSIGGPLEDRIEILRFLQDHISDNIYSLHNLHIPSHEKLPILTNLSNYDDNFILEKSSKELLHLLSTPHWENSTIEKHLHCFSKILEESTLDIDSILSWLTIICIKCEKQIKDLDPSVNSITEKLFQHCSNKQHPDWDNAFIIWNKLLSTSGIHEAHIINLLSQTNITQLSGTILYAISTYLESTKKIAPLANDSYYSYNVGIDHLADSFFFTNTTQYFVHTSSPKWAAGFLKLIQFVLTHTIHPEKNTCFQNNNMNSFLDSLTKRFITQIKSYWRELPLLLQAFVMFNQSYYADKILKNINLNDEVLHSQEIYDYIMIAYIVKDFSFIQKTYHALDLYDEAYTYTATLLKSETLLLTTDIGRSFFRPSRFTRLHETNPIAMTRLMTMLCKDNSAYQAFTNDTECQNAASYILGNIRYIYQQSPQVAIDFLSSIKRLKRWFKASTIFNDTVKILYLQAQLNGQIEEALQLKALLN